MATGRLGIIQDSKYQRATDRPTDRIEDPKKEAKPGNILRDIAKLEHALLLELSTQRLLFDVDDDGRKIGIKLILRRERFDSDAYIHLCIDGPKIVVDEWHKASSGLKLIWSVDVDEPSEHAGLNELDQKEVELNWDNIEYFVGYEKRGEPEWFGRIFGQVEVFSYRDFRLLFEPEYFLTKSYPCLKLRFVLPVLANSKSNIVVKVCTFMFEEISHPCTLACIQTQQMENVHSSNAKQYRHLKKRKMQQQARNLIDEGLEILNTSKFKKISLPLTNPDTGAASECIFELERFKYFLEFHFEKVRLQLEIKIKR